MKTLQQSLFPSMPDIHSSTSQATSLAFWDVDLVNKYSVILDWLADLDGERIALMSFAFLASLIHDTFTHLSLITNGWSKWQFLSYSILFKLLHSLINPHFQFVQNSSYFCQHLPCCCLTVCTIAVAFNVNEYYLRFQFRIHFIILNRTGYNTPGFSSNFCIYILPEDKRTKMLLCKLKFQLSTYWFNDISLTRSLWAPRSSAKECLTAIH